MMTLISTAATQAASAGGGISIAQAVRVCMAAGLTFLVMRQVMPMAAGLASGLALSTFGAVSAALSWGLAGATRSAARVAGAGTRYLGRQAMLVPRIAGWRENTIRPEGGRS
jgi:type IV secretion system protein VirB6